jgi:hypothetical protein
MPFLDAAAALRCRLSLTMPNPKEKRPLGALAYLPALKDGVSREAPDESSASPRCWRPLADL